MSSIPLPETLRPTKLSDYVGQEDLVGKNKIIERLLAASVKTGFFPSLIFWGPPGSGKTTLARIIATETKREFFEFSAVSTSVKEIQSIIPKRERGNIQKALFAPPIVFIDEIHRFNKAQQDRLLPFVEKGDMTIIGATTENPSFEVIGPLLSRSRVITLHKLQDADIIKIIKRGEKFLKKKLVPKGRKYLLELSNGDARIALNVLEIAANIAKSDSITLENLKESAQSKLLSFDRNGEEHYNTISAFIKSMRASQTDAALYYLARMIESGQDPKYIARRMIIFASEDIGMAVPTALVVANEVFRACEIIGYPECAINLAHGTVYLASAKKDRSAYDAYFAALEDVKKLGNLEIPLMVRNAPTELMKSLDYGKDYEMYTNKSFLPPEITSQYYKKKN